MRISDWSSDVCSSDLPKAPHRRVRPFWTSTSTAGHSPVALQSCKTLATRSRLSSTRIRSPAVSTSDTRWSLRSEEHTSELQSLMRISYAVFCLKKKTIKNKKQQCTNILDITQQHH